MTAAVDKSETDGLQPQQQQRRRRPLSVARTSSGGSRRLRRQEGCRDRWWREKVDFLQNLVVSPSMLRLLRRYTTTHNSSSISNNKTMRNTNNVDDEERLIATAARESETDETADDIVYWISGLDQVVFHDQSVADAVVIAGSIRPWPYLCYMLSGMICDIFMLLFDVFLHFGLGLTNATTCWLLGFGLSIVPRHAALKYMCFGRYIGGYYYSLARMYAGMSASIALSTVGNYYMTQRWGVPHYVAWLATLIWTGVVNYFVLKYLWAFGAEVSTSKGTENE
jgi:hypothetical protein